MTRLDTAHGGTMDRSTAVNMRALTPFQRALLVIDGTVTTFIEAYTLEPVSIERLGEAHDPVAEDRAWLELAEGEEVAHRAVLIEGTYSRTLYVYASSLVVPGRLPAAVRQKLEVQGAGLGRLLNDEKLETRREVLRQVREHVADLPEAVRTRTDGEFVTRVYRIIAQGRPVALITERFPCALGSLASRD
jgi:chorismate-pyruvate lyase